MTTNNATGTTITCRYLPFKFEGTAQHFPLIHVYLKASLAELNTVGLVDSGATSTFIPYEIAETIGLLPEGNNSNTSSLVKGRATGAAGVFTTYQVTLPVLNVMKSPSQTIETFRDIKVQVAAESRDNLPHVILGRDPLFRHFDITFHEKRQKFTFSRV